MNSLQVKGQEQGFTILELIIVIVLLGILSVVVVSKYKDLRGEAASAHADGVFGAAQMAAARHFGKKLMGQAPDNITQCSDLVAQMEEDPTKAGWSCAGKDLSVSLGGKTYTVRITSNEDSSTKAGLCCTWGDNTTCTLCP